MAGRWSGWGPDACSEGAEGCADSVDVEAFRIDCVIERVDGRVDRVRVMGDANDRMGRDARSRWLGAIMNWDTLLQLAAGNISGEPGTEAWKKAEQGEWDKRWIVKLRVAAWNLENFVSRVCTVCTPITANNAGPSTSYFFLVSLNCIRSIVSLIRYKANMMHSVKNSPEPLHLPWTN
jgi:hypothetical protein